MKDLIEKYPITIEKLSQVKGFGPLFEKLELGTDLVKPSNVISFENLDKKIESLSKERTDASPRASEAQYYPFL